MARFATAVAGAGELVNKIAGEVARLRLLTGAIKIFNWKREPKNIFFTGELNSKMRSKKVSH